ncbi:hypothetical protein DUNSADRAFT_8896 [Dunaliella salina]|uniref:Uncharacterized protein n=1 Tax=Dunaliella salina TaxID=3046 RepID=A0ABQ7GIL1_DUNSA|nr:hypothetical protein DUNSADRAFT_8896 [Dunaliella salina]|eukprot:KAF5834433.1 hypothetical protein DUNSADRAFT_8896 [Dunaliella salina]
MMLQGTASTGQDTGNFQGTFVELCRMIECLDDISDRILWATSKMQESSTGELSLGVCYCLSCLPPAFGDTAFTIAAPLASDSNIPDMPGGPYIATIQAPLGVDVSVTGTPKVGGARPFGFNNTGSGSGTDGSDTNGSDTDGSGITNGSVDQSVRLPDGGLSDLLIQIFVPKEAAKSNNGDNLLVQMQYVFGPPSPTPPVLQSPTFPSSPVHPSPVAPSVPLPPSPQPPLNASPPLAPSPLPTSPPPPLSFPPPRVPSAPPIASCPCDSMPEAENGMCDSGKALVRFGLAGNNQEQDHLRCFSGLTEQSPDVLSFLFCISYTCLPPPLQGQQLNVTVEAVMIPNGPTSFDGNKTATLVTFFVPSCIAPSLTTYKLGEDGKELVPFSSKPGQNGVFKISFEGMAALSLHARVEPECDNRYVAGLVTAAFVQDGQPPVPTSSCPCWATPQDAVDPNENGCDGIKIPVTLETKPSWHTDDGVSYRQCIDPANFDFFTERMAFSYCWRYHCLPSEFSRSEFTATILGIRTFNIPRMPGGVIYNTTLQATPGVKIDVVGHPKDQKNASLVEFSHDNNHGGVVYKGGDWVTMNITLPEKGLDSFDIKYTVPIGYDDLSAAVVMEIRPDQELPAQPPAPPGTICRCPDPAVNGQCADGNAALATFSRLDDGSSATTQLCLLKPSYNLFTKMLVFSTCWRWGCLDPAFRGSDPNKIKPYRIRMQGVEGLNLELMRGGQASMELLKPPDVEISFSASGSTQEGPYDESGLIVMPRSTTNVDISIDIPPYPWYDNNNAAIIIEPGPFPPTPPTAPISPPLPPAPPRDPTITTKVVAKFTVLTDIDSAADLESFLALKAADIEAGIDGYLTNQLLGLVDYSRVEDCSQASLDAFASSLAQVLGVQPSELTLDCSYVGSSTANRRRNLLVDRMLLQAPMCPGQKLTLGLQRDFKVGRGSDASTVDDDIAESRGKLLNSLGSEACVGPELRYTRVFLSQFKSTTLSTAEQCADLRRSLSVQDTDVVLPECTEEEEEEEEEKEEEEEEGDGKSGSPTAEIVPSTSPSSSSRKVDRNLAIGLGAGLGGTVVLLAMAFVIHKRRKSDTALRRIVGKGYQANRRTPVHLPLHTQTLGATSAQRLVKKIRGRPHHSVFLTHSNPLAYSYRGAVGEGVLHPDSEPSFSRMNELVHGANNGPSPLPGALRGETAAVGGLYPAAPGTLQSLTRPAPAAGAEDLQTSPTTCAPSSYTKHSNPYFSDAPSVENVPGWRHL